MGSWCTVSRPMFYNQLQGKSIKRKEHNYLNIKRKSDYVTGRYMVASGRLCLISISYKVASFKILTIALLSMRSGCGLSCGSSALSPL